MDILIFLSEFMVPLTVFYIVGSGILTKRPVFDDFLDGAKEGIAHCGGCTSDSDRTDDSGGSFKSFGDS